jgi:hypothetical protein
MTNALAACAPNLGAFVSEEALNAHDYIAFPEAKEPTSNRPRDRKAA